jgi:hypothetical protein
MREFRVISAILIRKRNYKIAFSRKSALAKARGDFGFDPVYDLTVERYIIVRKIDILLEKSRLCDQGKPNKQKENSAVHIREIISNGFHGKALVCRSDYDDEHQLAIAIPPGCGHDFPLHPEPTPAGTPDAAGSLTAFI